MREHGCVRPFFREAIESQRGVQRQAARRFSGEDPPSVHGHQQVISMPIFFASDTIHPLDIIRAGCAQRRA